MSSTLTTFLNLVKPTPGTKEPYSRATENVNLDTLDKAIGPKFTNVATITAANTLTETEMYGANILAPAAQQTTWRIVAFGVYGNNGAVTLTLRAKLGGVFIGGVGIVVAATGSSRCWRAESEIVCMTTGAAGTWAGTSLWNFNNGGVMQSAVDGSQPTFVRDTTVVSSFQITAQWSALHANNSILCAGAYVHRVTNA